MQSNVLKPDGLLFSLRLVRMGERVIEMSDDA